MRPLLITLLCFAVGFPAQLSIGSDRSNSDDNGSSWERAFEEMVSNARWKYTYYFWPELGVLHPDTLGLKNIVLGLDEPDAGHPELLFSSKKDGLFLSEKLTADYFRSSYYLGFSVPTDAYVTGGPPLSFIVIEQPNSSALTRFRSWFTGESEKFVNDRFEEGPDLTASIEYVLKDFRIRKNELTTSDFYGSSIEAITFVSTDLPLFLIADINTVRDLSNAFENDEFWRRVASDLEFQKRLGQPMIESPRSALLADFPEVTGPYNDSLFVEFRPVVVPPRIDTLASNHVQVALWTWTPFAGSLIKWEVEFDSKRMVNIRYEYVSRYFGFWFHWA